MTGGRPGLEVAGLSGELAAVMRGVVTHLMALPGADGASLSMLDGDAAAFAVCAGADAPLQGRTIPLERTLGRECLSRGEVTVLRATMGPEVDRCLTPGAQAIVLAPVAYDGAVRGILGVRSPDGEAFDADEVESIRMLAAGAAIALRNAELVERLEESARGYRALHAEAVDAAIVTDRTGRILDANEAAVSLLGHPASELRGMSARDLLAGGPARAILRDALASEGEVRAERLFQHRDGRELRLEYSAQVIVNLAVNARDAMPQGGALTIETANVDRDGARLVELRLTDTGVGMSDLERSRLFDPFFTTKEGGTGLGLATVYGIVEQSGGAIEVDSAPGHGASFRILLPRVDVPAEAQAPATVGAKPAAGSETILLVEDEPVVRRLLAEILTGNGYSVLQAGDGPSAVELLRRRNEPVDLLVTDVVLPGMSGPEVAHAVLSLRPETHVLYLSGYTDSAIVQHGVLEPGIAFLQKPFGAAELTAKVRGLLDGAPAGVD